jgi:hypothetical protein
LPTRARRTAEADAGACLPSLTQLLRGGRATNQPDLAAVRLQGPNQPFAILGGLRSPPPPAGLMTGANREAQHSCNSSNWIPCRCCRAGDVALRHERGCAITVGVGRAGCRSLKWTAPGRSCLPRTTFPPNELLRMTNVLFRDCPRCRMSGEWGDVCFGLLQENRKRHNGSPLSTGASLYARSWAEMV